jgi:hypothetical protein
MGLVSYRVTVVNRAKWTKQERTKTAYESVNLPSSPQNLPFQTSEFGNSLYNMVCLSYEISI